MRNRLAIPRLGLSAYVVQIAPRQSAELSFAADYEMTEESAPIKEGQLVAGKYRVGRILGQGGMGVVVAATHVQLGQRVALKLLLPSSVERPEVVTRFTREAQAAAKIQSEHVARVLDVGALESGAPYMVMEYLDGEDLEQALARRGALPASEAVDYLLQGCEAVAEAHSLGIIHRDLKPANLYLAKRPGGRPIVKVLDFGISKTPSSTTSPGLTQTTAMFGSPPYMSPEQVTSTRSADARSDIWSLGAVLYELLTQRRPFNGESVPEIFVAILHTEPDPPHAHRREIPAGLDAVVMRCLRKDAGSRYPDVAALAAALGPFGPASSAQSVERIAHILGVGRPGFEPTILPDAAPSPELPAPPAGGVPGAAALSTVPSPPTYADAASIAVRPAAQPRAAASATATSRAPSRDKATRVILAVVAILVVGASGTAYWLGGRRAQAPSDPRTAMPAEAPAVRAPASKAPAAESGAPAPSPKAAAVQPPPARHPASAAKLPRERGTVAGTTLATAPVAADDPKKSTPPVAAPSVPSTICADLLERESLGETLTPKEKVVYARQCRR